MKKIIFLIFFITTIHLHAQTSIYHPFPDSNAIWCCGSGNALGLGCFVQRNSTYQLNGQTLIGGILYNRMLHYETFYDNCPPDSSSDTTTYYIRQDTALKKVWMYDFTVNRDTILFDFDLHIGDTLNATNQYWTHYFGAGNYWIVISIDSIVINGQYRKRFNYEMLGASGWCPSSIIEGIGPIHGLFYPPSNCFEYGAQLNVFIQDNSILVCQSIDTNFYVNNFCHDFISGVNEIETNNQYKIYPNPFHYSAILKVNKVFEDSELYIYNVFGERVEKLIINGESVIINRDELDNGFYLFQIRTRKGNVLTGKFIIE